MGIFGVRQKNSSNCKGFRCKTTASPPKTAQKSTSGASAENHRHQINPSQSSSCTDCSKAPPPGSSPQTSSLSPRKVVKPAVSAGERGLRRVGGQQQGKQDIPDRGIVPQLQHRRSGAVRPTGHHPRRAAGNRKAKDYLRGTLPRLHPAIAGPGRASRPQRENRCFCGHGRLSLAVKSNLKQRARFLRQNISDRTAAAARLR